MPQAQIFYSCCSKSCWQLFLLAGILATCLVLVFVHSQSKEAEPIRNPVDSFNAQKDAELGDGEEEVSVKSHSVHHGSSKTKKQSTKFQTSTKAPEKTKGGSKILEDPGLDYTPPGKNAKEQKYKVGTREVYLEGANRESYPVKTLPPGKVQNFKLLLEECKKSGKDFEDPEFNPKGKRDLIGNVDLLSSNDYPKWKGKFLWKRPKELNKKVVFSTIDDKGKRYRLSDITQGSLGDCYYLSALGLVTTHKKLINFIVPEDNNHDTACGIYHFRFWIRGFFYDIVVDDRLPYIDTDGKGDLKLAFTEMSGIEMWPVLIEKAYAKIYGSYEIIEGGVVSEALEDMTGGIVETVILSKSKMNFDLLNPGNEFIGFTGLGTPEKAIKGLIDGHAYAFLRKETVYNKSSHPIELVRLRNPWGSTEWTGDWSDESPMWDTMGAIERDYLNQVKDDGEFWMSIDSATNSKVFDRAYNCYWWNDLEPKPPVIFEFQAPLVFAWNVFHGKWDGKGKQDPKTPEGLANKPQYVIQLSSASNAPAGVIVMSLMYKNYIARRNKIPSLNLRLYQIMDKDLAKQKPPFSAQAFKSGKLKRHTFEPIARISNTREYCTGGRFPVGSYVVIPLVEPAAEKGEFLLRVVGEVKET